MGRGRKALLVLGIVVIAAAAGLYVTGRWFGGWSKVDDWVGQQIVGAVSAHIVPTIAFQNIEYAAPYSVTLEAVTLTSPDGTQVVSIDRADLTLGEVPRSGRPIVFRSITLHRPTLHLIRESGEGIHFRGLVPFTKPSLNEATSVPEEFRLSHILRLDRVVIQDGSVSYDPADGRPQMQVGGMTLALDVADDGASVDDAWHTLNIQAGRLPSLRIDLSGRLNTDTFDAEIARGRFDMVASPETRATLPPAVQEAVAVFDPRGQVTLQISGSMPGLRWDRSTLTGAVDVVDLGINLSDYRLPIDRLAAAGRLTDGVMTLDTLDGKLLSGVISAGAQGKPADGTQSVTFNWSVYDLDLNQLARTKAREGEAPTLAGRMNASGQITAEPGKAETIAGAGILSIREGTLIRFPLFLRLANLLSKTSDTTGRDTIDAEFAFTPRGVQVTKLIALLPFTAARVTGLVAYDGALDLEMNAGPLERIQNALGVVGDVMGKVTDQVVTYHVGGYAGDPKVSVDPFGFAVGGSREAAPPGG